MDVLRLRRLMRVLAGRAGLWCVYLPIACACLASGARAGAVEHELDRIAALVGAAHFHTALALTKSTRDLLGGLRDEPQLGAWRAHLEVMAATAEVALGQRARARQSMIRALHADPALLLDERETSPKVLEVLRAARRHIRTAEPVP